jgi:radical SAM superfamily enzyme YgiQ (UPF0313 family)
MRVFLLNPPPDGGINLVREGRCMQRTSTWTAVWSPITLATCAAILRQEGFEVALTDGSVEATDGAAVKNFMAEWQPSLVVINTATSSIEYDLSVAAMVKEACPQAKTMALGIHPSALPDNCFELSGSIDMLSRGEPEYTVRDAALAMRSDTGLQNVQGLSYRQNGEVFHNSPRPFIEDLDALPYPAWDLIDTGLYRMPVTGKRFLLVGTARGCPYGCKYCTNKVYYGAKVRQRSPGRIADEIEWAIREYGVRDFLFWSESFTNDQQNAIDTAREISRRGLDVSWVCNSRVDTVSDELLGAIKQAGCWMIGFGIECGNQEILDTMKKGTTLDQAMQAVKMAHKAGLEVTGHLVLGLPGETEQTMKQTYNFAKSLKLDYAQFYCAVAFPGSRLYEECREAGYFNTNEWSMFEQNYSIINTPTLDSKKVMKARERAALFYYCQPRVIAHNVKKIRSPRDLTPLFHSLKSYLRHTR